MRDFQSFIDNFIQWAENREDIVAVALAGSYAHGTAKADSDIDLILFAASPEFYLQDETWLHQFGTVEKLLDEDWGMVQSRRVFYRDSFEVEFGITTPAWASINPVDNGTRRVVSDGIKILRDQTGILQALIQRVEALDQP